MSAYWDVVCIDCDEKLGLHGNHQESAANSIADDAVKLSSAPGLYVDFYGETTNTFSTDFFVKHKGHRIAARNEYGDLSGRCGVYTPCSSCERSGSCNLAPGHDGPHNLSRRPPAD